VDGINNTSPGAVNGHADRATVAALASAKRLPADFLTGLGLSDLPKGGVGIAYYDATGAEVAIKQRTALKAAEGSYWPKGKPLMAYGCWRIDRANKTGFLILVEGESDCWAVWHHGLPALGIPGANAVMTLLKEYIEGVPTIYVHREPDKGGTAFVEGVGRRLADLKFAGKAFELRMPEGVKDPAELHAHDPKRFKAALEEAIRISAPVELSRPGRNCRRPGSASGGGNATELDVTDDRPAISITTDEHLVNDEAVAALARDASLYQRGGLLVRIVRDVSPAAKGVRRAFAPRIESLPPALLRERLAANARWLSPRETNGGTEERPSRPPAWCVAAVHARADWPSIRHLEAVVDYPFLRPDGSLLDREGYDPETGLLLEPTGRLAVVPACPTLKDALAAGDALLEVVSDFPFESPVHRAAWLAALLTPLARFAFTGPAPLFLVDANVRGAGKGLLLDCISRIVTGEPFTIAAYTSDEDELRKRITSLALAGDRLVLFDNLEGRFGNAVLDAALTGTAWKDRVLGVNRMAEAPLYMTWYATGNNVAVAADTARRICHCRLESPEERPEERSEFRHPDLLEWVGANRGQLLAAALTILRAYCAAGRPDKGLSPWGSFEGWSRLVRSAVVWVELPDLGETRLLLQESADVTAECMSVLLECWEQMDPTRRGLTAAEAVKQYRESPEPRPVWHVDFVAAMEMLLGKPDARGLGTKLRDYRRRIFGKRFIDRAGEDHRAVRWAVFPATDFRRRLEDTRSHSSHSSRCGLSSEDEVSVASVDECIRPEPPQIPSPGTSATGGRGTDRRTDAKRRGMEGLES
jgi:hypothetical protein